jgi:hypothetical protein
VQAVYLGRGTPFADRRDERRFGYNPVDRARAEWDPARFHAAAGLAEPWVTWPRCPIFRRDAGAKRLDHDPAFGTLWYRDLDRDGRGGQSLRRTRRLLQALPAARRRALRPIRADGTFGEPQLLTSRNAVASTFGLRGAEYAPNVETWLPGKARG